MKTYDLVLTRELDAPRKLVFEAWTDPRHLAQWWGSHHFTNPVCRFEARQGGAIRIDMKGPDGTVYPMGGEVKEISPHSRLVFTAIALDAQGKALIENLNTVTFGEENGRTTIRLEVKVLSHTDIGEQHLKGMEQGWSESLERLADILPTANRQAP